MERNYDFRIFDSLESTNSEAVNHISGYSKPTWIWTRTQTKGRGRAGRTWISGSNNFFATYLQKTDEAIRLIPLRSFLSGLALHETLCYFTDGNYEFFLKWPNDVVLMRKKVAGILLENISQAGTNYLITGFGVNLHEVPELEGIPTRKLDPGGIAQLTGFNISSREFLDVLAERVTKFEKTYNSCGFSRIRDLWLDHAFDLGKRITFRSDRKETKGVFEGIDDQGRSIIATHQGKEFFSAGDMIFEETKSAIGN